MTAASGLNAGHHGDPWATGRVLRFRTQWRPAVKRNQQKHVSCLRSTKIRVLSSCPVFGSASFKCIREQAQTLPRNFELTCSLDSLESAWFCRWPAVDFRTVGHVVVDVGAHIGVFSRYALAGIASPRQHC